jgi:4'-phosphopantetheinyl transferase
MIVQYSLKELRHACMIHAMATFKKSKGDMVNIYVCDVVSEECAGHQLHHLLNLLPSWRREKALSYKYEIDQYLCARVFMLLQEGLSRDYGIKDDIQFSYNSNGKPFLINHPEIHFSLSHCRKGAACAISRIPVGIDIEEIVYDDDLAKFVLSEDDYKDVIASSHPAESFTTAWTEKESYLKMLGWGIIDNLKELDTQKACFSTIIERERGYVMTLCSKEKRELKIHFSGVKGVKDK